MKYTKKTFSIILLFSSVVLYGGNTEKRSGRFYAVKSAVATTANKVKEDIKTGINDAKKDIQRIENFENIQAMASDILQARQDAAHDRAEATLKVKTAVKDTAIAFKENAKAKVQEAKSELAQRKAVVSRGQAKKEVKHATATTACAIKDEVVAKTEAVKETAHSTVNRVKQAYHHARAEHNKKAAQRHIKAAVKDAAIAIQEEAKAKKLS